MLVAVELEEESNVALLGDVGGIGLLGRLARAIARVNVVTETYQLQDASGAGLLLSVLREEEQTLAGLARPSSSGVANLGLLATEVGGEAVLGDGLLAEPEELLGVGQAPAARVRM